MKSKLTLFLLSLIFLGVATADVVSGSERNFTFTPQVGIPDSNFQTDKKIPIGEEKNGTTSSTLLADYISSFYTYALNILGVLAVLILMAGGVQWIISGGNTQKIENAKKMISGSLFGGALLLGSYILLNTINPELTKLPIIKMTTIDRLETGCCDKALDDGTAKTTNTKNCAEGKLLPNHAVGASGKCESKTCCIQYTNNKKEEVKSCTMKLADYCTGDNVKLGAGNCVELTSCNDVKVTDENCRGVPNGEAAKNTNEVIINSWCYNGKLHTGNAYVGEPCGTKKGSLCFKVGATECNRDWAGGGRNCEDSTCCETYSDGTMKK